MDDKAPGVVYISGMTTQRYTSARKFLLDELMRRQKRNHSYSQRAFARDLEILPSRLSELMSGKVGISFANANKIAGKLGLPDDEKSMFLDLVQSEFGRSAAIRKASSERLRDRLQEAYAFKQEEFNVISDWYHAAILELVDLKSFEATAKHVSKRLGISDEIAGEALERLKRLNILQINGTKATKTHRNRGTTLDIPSAYIRKSHAQVLRKAEECLETKPVDQRDYSYMMFAMPKKKVSHLKKVLLATRRELVQEIEALELEGGDSVFCLAMQCFEVTEN